MRGDDFKQYVHQLRGKSAVYKKKRLEVGELRAEFGVLSRTLEILKGKDAIIANMVVSYDGYGHHDSCCWAYNNDVEVDVSDNYRQCKLPYLTFPNKSLYHFILFFPK